MNPLYENEVVAAVAKVNPNAVAAIMEDAFSIIPELGKRDFIAISQILRSDKMTKFTYYRQSLFNGYYEEQN